MNIWVRRHGRDRFYEHSLSDSIAPNLGQFKEHGLDDVGHCKDAEECFNWEFTWFRKPPAVIGLDTHRLEAHPDIRIPDKLLTGPWTNDNINLLFWLWMNNARVKEDQNWEVCVAISSF
jgi:hypothetical protein